MKNCAVLISGPIRYLESTIKRLIKISGNVDLEFFIFVWANDEGNKIRLSEESASLDKISKICTVRSLTVAKPFVDNDYNLKICGAVESGQSALSNIMGMFKSMDVLCKLLSISPHEYDAALRIRTDCIVLDKKFFEHEYDLNKVHVSKNFKIPHKWVSDHMMLSSPENLIKFWSWETSERLYSKYSRNKLNPEKLLGSIRKERKLDIVESWLRYLDYHILYYPIRNGEPDWVQSALNTYSISELYENVDFLFNRNDKDLLDEISRQKDNQDYYAKNKIHKLAILIYRKLKS